MGVGKFDKTLDLGEGKRRPVLMYILDALAHVMAVYNAVRHDAGTADDGPTGDLARNLLDQFASHPVNACTYV
jgi:hypothetical protein